MKELAESIRTEIWDQMLEADRLSRYYGALANKIGKRERWTAIVTTAFATGSTLGFGLAFSSVFTGLMILGTLVASLWPLVYRSSGSLTSVILCHKRICEIHTRSKFLWINIEAKEVNEADAHDTLCDLISELSEVSRDTTGAVSYNDKIYKQTERETDAFWNEYKEREVISV